MINKNSVWFLTLFSLILVLSVYYVTMPSELLLNKEQINQDNTTVVEENEVVKVEESEMLVALRVEADEQLEVKMNELKEILTSSNSTVDEKNNAYEKIKSLNSTRTDEKTIEEAILKEYNLKAFVKIDGDQIKVIVDSNEHNVDIANNIMRLIQSNYDTNKYITVKFQDK